MKKSFFPALCALSLLTAGCVSETTAEVPAVLLQNGKSAYQIVLPDHHENIGTDTHLLTAAKCLQKEFRTASGVTLPIRKESAMDVSKPAIYIGNTAALRKEGIDTTSLPDFGGVILVRNGNLFLAGNDCHVLGSRKKESYSRYLLGSVKAIVVFMEDYLGTRFVMPGETGISTPVLKKLELPERLSSQGLLDVLNAIMSREEFMELQP